MLPVDLSGLCDPVRTNTRAHFHYVHIHRTLSKRNYILDGLMHCATKSDTDEDSTVWPHNTE